MKFFPSAAFPETYHSTHLEEIVPHPKDHIPNPHLFKNDGSLPYLVLIEGEPPPPKVYLFPLDEDPVDFSNSPLCV